MAQTLSQRIKSKGGQLAETSLEEQAAMLGRGAPSQPLEAKVMGAGPDQAKMMGTPAAAQSALRAQVEGGQDLATRIRREGPRRAATAQEQAQLEQAGRLGQLGNLDSRVEQLAQQALAQGAGQTEEVQLEAQATDPETQSLLERIQTDPNDFQAIQQLNQKLGRGAGDSLSASELTRMYGGQEEQIARAFGRSVQDALEAGNLNFEEMGFAGAEDVAGLLGVSPEQLSGMSIKQLTDQINTAIETEQNQVADLQARLDDPRLGPAERAEARSQLRDLGAVGIRSAESDLEIMAEELQDADQIQFMGEEIPVDTLLSDEYLSGVMASYLDGLDPDTLEPITDSARKIQESQPEFAEFAKRHRNILEQASSQIGEGVKAFAELQTQNQMLSQAKTGERLPDEMMAQIFPDWGELRDSAYDVKQYPMLELLSSDALTPEQANTLVKTSKNLYQQFPEFSRDFAKLSKVQLEKIGALGDPRAALDFDSKLREMKKLEQMERPEEMASVLGVDSLDELRKMRGELIKQINFGTLDKGILQKLPGLKSGDWNETFAYLKSKKPEDLQQVLADMGTISDTLSSVKEASSTRLDLPGSLDKAFLNNKQISAKELTQYGTSDYRDLAKLLDEHRDKLDRSGLAKAEEMIKRDLSKTLGKDIKGKTGMSVADLMRDAREPANVEDAIQNVDRALASVASLAAQPGVGSYMGTAERKLKELKQGLLERRIAAREAAMAVRAPKEVEARPAEAPGAPRVVSTQKVPFMSEVIELYSDGTQKRRPMTEQEVKADVASEPETGGMI